MRHIINEFKIGETAWTHGIDAVHRDDLRFFTGIVTRIERVKSKKRYEIRYCLKLKNDSGEINRFANQIFKNRDDAVKAYKAIIMWGII